MLAADMRNKFRRTWARLVLKVACFKEAEERDRTGIVAWYRQVVIVAMWRSGVVVITGTAL